MARPIAVGKRKPGLDRVLGRRDLILLFVVAVANLNLIPAISASGPITLWLWLLALACFFWPQGAAVTELAQKWPGEGGIYLWAKRSFGEEHGFLAGWCYWLSNVVYLPTVVLSCVGVGVYIAGPRIQKLADSQTFTGIAALLIILFLLALNVRGLSLGKWISNLGALGTIGGAAIICLLAVMTLRHHASALHLPDLHPDFHDWRLIAAFGTICYSLVGLDLASIMGDEIRDPKRNLPISIFFGGVIAGLIYLGTTLAMLIAMPQKEIGVLSGILQAINVMSTHTGIFWVVAPLALLECIAILGTASAWFSGAARLPFVAGVDRYLPPIIGRVHPRYHTPYISLILFAVLSLLLIATSFMGVSVGEAYLTMLDSRGHSSAFAQHLHVPRAAQAHLGEGRATACQQVLSDHHGRPGPGRHSGGSGGRLYPFAPGQFHLDFRGQAHRRLRHRFRLCPLLLPERDARRPPAGL